MKIRYATLALALLALPMLANASCDAVKASIDAKLQAKHVSNYTLDVLPASQTSSAGKVVGQCEGNKQIVYTRGAAAAKDKAAPAAKSDAAKPEASASG